MSERVIKCRAKVKYDMGTYYRKGDWYYFRITDGCAEPLCEMEVYLDWSTLGQFTTLHDKNGKEIYEGDIMGFKFDNEKRVGEVTWSQINVQFLLYYGKYWIWYEFKRCKELEVIGNIYESSELLNGK